MTLSDLCRCSPGVPQMFFGACLISAAPVFASTYLDELVVTGTRSERTVLDTPVRTEVVTAEELKRTHARSLKEALENVSGIQLRQIHGKPGYEVWMQGIDADRVLVLVDGLPVTATTGSAVDLSQMSVLDIERIEVVKGAVSAQYGSSGMGGVVNVITRKTRPGVRGSITADAGTYGDQNPSAENWDAARYSGRASVEAGSEHWGIRLSGSSQHSDGVDPQPETWARPGDEYDRNDASVRLQWHPDAANRVALTGSVFDESSESRYSSQVASNSVSQMKTEEVQRWRTQLSGEHDLNAGTRGGWALLHESLSDDTEKRTVNGRFDSRSADITLSQASANVQTSVGQNHLLQAGVDIRRETLEQFKDGVSELSANDDFSREGYEIWLQDAWMLTDNIELVPGLRAQRDSDFGNHYAPKVNARWELGSLAGLDQVIRAGVGSGYRVPNLKERHFRFDHSSQGYIVQGNPALEPESSISYQLGWAGYYDKLAWVEVHGFYNDIKDLIQTGKDQQATDLRGDGIQVFRYANLDKARTYGVEAGAGWQPANNWSLSAGYTWTQTEDRNTGDDLNRRPEHQAQLSVDGPLGIANFAWSLRLRHQSSEFVDAATGSKSPAYTTADLKLNYQVVPKLRLFAGVDNLADVQRDFADQDDFRPVAGRFLYTGLTLTLGDQ